MSAQPIQLIRRQFHSHQALQYLRSFFLVLLYMAFISSNSSMNSRSIALIQSVVLNWEWLSAGPLEIWTQMATRKQVKSSMSRNQHQVEQRSKTNLLKTSLLILTPSSLKASWVAMRVSTLRQSSLSVKMSTWMPFSSFYSRQQKFQLVISSHLLVETMPSQVRHSATSLTQSFRADTRAFSSSNVGSRDFCSLRLNQINQRSPISKGSASGTLNRSRTFFMISWKRGWQQMASFRSMSVACLFLSIQLYYYTSHLKYCNRTSLLHSLGDAISTDSNMPSMPLATWYHSWVIAFTSGILQTCPYHLFTSGYLQRSCPKQVRFVIQQKNDRSTIDSLSPVRNLVLFTPRSWSNLLMASNIYENRASLWVLLMDWPIITAPRYILMGLNIAGRKKP